MATGDQIDVSVRRNAVVTIVMSEDHAWLLRALVGGIAGGGKPETQEFVRELHGALVAALEEDESRDPIAFADAFVVRDGKVWVKP